MKSLNKTISTLVVGAILALLHLGVAANAQASTVTFKGGDIVADASPTVNNNLTWTPGVQSTPIVGDGRVDFGTTQSIGTYTRPNTVVDPTRFNQWLGSLAGTGLGISEFSLWLQGGNSNQAALWGETIAFSDPTSSAITAFASSGWTASVYTLVEADWGAAWTGRKLITYTANDSSNYLKPGTTAEFGFTADIMGNNGATGPDYQMWVGADGASIFDPSGNQPVYGEANYFQRAITAHVPDNGATLALLGVAFLGLATMRRRFVR